MSPFGAGATKTLSGVVRKVVREYVVIGLFGIHCGWITYQVSCHECKFYAKNFPIFRGLMLVK